MITSSRSRESSAPCQSIVASRSLSARASVGWFNSTWKMLSSAM
jgi:hypothetical protein